MFKKERSKGVKAIILAKVQGPREVKAGITFAGDTFTDKVALLVDGMVLNKTSRSGDVAMPVAEFTAYIEAKSSSNMNQIRPTTYCILVAKTEREDLPCIVIPAHCLVEMAQTRRGQHTEDAMKCMNLNGRSDALINEFGCREDQVRAKVLEAFEADNNSSRGIAAKKMVAQVERSYTAMLAERAKYAADIKLGE